MTIAYSGDPVEAFDSESGAASGDFAESPAHDLEEAFVDDSFFHSLNVCAIWSSEFSQVPFVSINGFIQDANGAIVNGNSPIESQFKHILTTSVSLTTGVITTGLDPSIPFPIQFGFPLPLQVPPPPSYFGYVIAQPSADQTTLNFVPIVSRRTVLLNAGTYLKTTQEADVTNPSTGLDVGSYKFQIVSEDLTQTIDVTNTLVRINNFGTVAGGFNSVQYFGRPTRFYTQIVFTPINFTLFNFAIALGVGAFFAANISAVSYPNV